MCVFKLFKFLLLLLSLLLLLFSVVVVWGCSVLPFVVVVCLFVVVFLVGQFGGGEAAMRLYCRNNLSRVKAQEPLCESRGGRAGLQFLLSSWFLWT